MGSPPPPPLKPNRWKQPRSASSSPPPLPSPPPGRSIPLLKTRLPLPSHLKQAGRSNQVRSGCRRVSFSDKESDPMVVKPPSRKLLMGDVTILKRGDPIPAAEDLSVLAGGEDLSPAAEDLRSDLAGGKNLSPAAEDLRSDLAGGEELLSLFTAELLGPDPEILPKQPEILPKQIGFSDAKLVYAGPAYITSPSPSSVPLPGFFFKKGSLIDDASAIATKGLCAMLRLHPIN